MMRKLRFGAFVAAAAAALAFAVPSQAATLYVAPTPPGVGVGTSCTLPSYNFVQAAINASAQGDTIIVCDGVYTEQVVVNKSLTLAGSGNAIIQAPAVLAADSPDGKKNIVEVTTAANVRMSGFTVAGPGPSGCGSIDTGIAVLDGATLDLSFTTVRNVRDNPFSGCQNGEGIRVGTQRYITGNLQEGHATIDHVLVTDYQKNGIVIAGTGSTGKITNTTVTGHGQTGVLAQNGIEVVDGAAATISTSTIRDHDYTPKKTTSCGLLVISAGGVNDDANVYLNNEKDKCVYGRGGTFEG